MRFLPLGSRGIKTRAEPKSRLVRNVLQLPRPSYPPLAINMSSDPPRFGRHPGRLAKEGKQQTQSHVQNSLTISKTADTNPLQISTTPIKAPSANSAVTIFHTLNADLRALASLFVFLEPSNKGVAESIALQASQQRLIQQWNAAGKVELVYIFGPLPVLAGLGQIDSAIRTLLGCEIVKYSGKASQSEDNPEHDRQISVDPEVRHFVQSQDDTIVWKVEALRLICRSFPRHGITEPTLFAVSGRSHLPILEHVLTYFEDLTFFKSWSAIELRQIIETLESSSYFSGVIWKNKTVSIAEVISKFLPGEPEDLQLSARLQFRKMLIARSFPRRPGEGPKEWIDKGGGTRLDAES
ncbi:hypothetical protein G7Y89_g2725 [Cudoniella acicularis]|uniref:Uncharacterized protein n=1 Tax=Cudoniella acicularis TaxID=354080 RepID=A0A8H4RUK6_9HELO|nr:hypothetical protein G7Y89_g2725 [Cudoniella acicularis]